MYQNRLHEIDELKAKIDSFRPLFENILKQIKAYFKISRQGAIYCTETIINPVVLSSQIKCKHPFGLYGQCENFGQSHLYFIVRFTRK